MKKLVMRLPLAVKVLLVAVVYFLIAYSSLQFSFRNSNATPVWPPSGFAFALLMLAGRRMVPGVFIGAFSVNLFTFLHNNTIPLFTAIPVSAAIGLGNTAEALTGYYLLHKLGRVVVAREVFRKVHTVFLFIFTALIMSVPSCTLGATAIYVAGIITGADYFTAWFTWWTGDASGILMVTPFLIVWVNIGSYFSVNKTVNILESILVLTGVIIATGVVFLDWFSPSFLFTRAFIILPFLIWSSVRLHLPMLTVVLLISAFMAVIGTISGVGPFVAPTLNESLLTVDTFISFNSIMVLVLHAAIVERGEKELFLQNAKNNLEELVHQRTQQLEEKNRELEFRNKELASFTYVASHDLQEPLRKIQTFTDMISTSHPDITMGAKDLFKKILISVSRMKQLIENLLTYSKVDKTVTAIRETDLNEVLREVKNDLSEKIRETGAVIESGALPRLKVIPFQMQQLFNNIISNAIKFRRKDSAPYIIFNGEWVPGSAIPNANQFIHYFHLTISDNGIGFEPQYSSKIFDIFQRLHSQSEYEGTGIGLAICKKIVETHQGFIMAQSEAGIGSTFHIYLPANGMY